MNAFRRASLPLISLLLLSPAGAQTDSQISLQFLSQGSTRTVVVELDDDRAPQTSANFRKLVESGYYEGLSIHRVIPNYLVQLGDPFTKEVGKKHLWGTGGPGYTVPAEIGGNHKRGALAMARLPDSENPSRSSSGSQFYIALDDLNQLDGDYTVFGNVVSGIQHLDYFSKLTADTNDVPVNRVEVRSAWIGEDAGREKVVAAAAEGLKEASKKVASAIPTPLRKDKEEELPPAPAPTENVVATTTTEELETTPAVSS
ncbi:MAG: peptidylprolyl isomerase, partial [Verrucomicrobiota bacterium]